MCQIVSCQEQPQNRRRSEFAVSAVEGIGLCQEDLECELKTLRVL
jgi:hypothetical protein